MNEAGIAQAARRHRGPRPRPHPAGSGRPGRDGARSAPRAHEHVHRPVRERQRSRWSRTSAISTPRSARSRWADRRPSTGDAGTGPGRCRHCRAALGSARPWRSRWTSSKPWSSRSASCSGRSRPSTTPSWKLVTNCEPWTVRRLASHALNNQLLWAGLVTGRPDRDRRGHHGRRRLRRRPRGVRRRGGRAEPGDVVDPGRADRRPCHAVRRAARFGGRQFRRSSTRLCHAWDLSASVGRPLEFPPESIPAVGAVVEATCTDAVRELGLIKAVAPMAPDASDTDRLMAKAGRSRP